MKSLRHPTRHAGVRATSAISCPSASAPPDAEGRLAVCRHCGRPIRLTPAGLGHAALLTRRVEADRHAATPSHYLKLLHELEAEPVN